MSDKHYVGRDVISSANNGKYKPVSRLTLMVDDNNAITAGDDTGFEIVADCPHATQDMVDSLLATLKGFEYQAFEAGAANIDPAAELGDGATVCGMYSAIARITDEGDGYMSISAPGEAEMEDEYPASGPMTQEFNRQLASVRSSITKTSEEILLKVEDTDGRVSKLSQKVDNITLEVSNNSKSSIISLSVDGVEVSSETIRFTGDVVFESDLKAGTTTVSGDCITTGLVSAEYIRLNGEMYIYEKASDDDDNHMGSFGYYQGWATDSDGNLTTTDGVGIQYSDTTGQLLCTNAGVWCGYGSKSGISAYSAGMTLKGSTIVVNGTLEDTSGSVITSDSRTKTDISYDMEKRLEVLYSLKPCTYRRTTGQRLHSGLIAQEVEAARNAAGIVSEDYAALCINAKGNYGIRYIEFVPELIAAVQNLNERIRALEGIA